MCSATTSSRMWIGKPLGAENTRVCVFFTSALLMSSFTCTHATHTFVEAPVTFEFSCSSIHLLFPFSLSRHLVSPPHAPFASISMLREDEFSIAPTNHAIYVADMTPSINRLAMVCAPFLVAVRLCSLLCLSCVSLALSLSSRFSSIAIPSRLLCSSPTTCTMATRTLSSSTMMVCV